MSKKINILLSAIVLSIALTSTSFAGPCPKTSLIRNGKPYSKKLQIAVGTNEALKSVYRSEIGLKIIYTDDKMSSCNYFIKSNRKLLLRLVPKPLLGIVPKSPEECKAECSDPREDEDYLNDMDWCVSGCEIGQEEGGIDGGSR